MCQGLMLKPLGEADSGAGHRANTKDQVSHALSLNA
jgi:hypothetical protein